MRGRTLKLIAAKELLDTLRDRRTLFIALVLPLLLYPALLLGLTQILGATQRNLQTERQRVLLEAGGAQEELASLLRRFELEPLLPDGRTRDVRDRLQETLEGDLDDAARTRMREMLRKAELAGAVLCDAEFSARLERDRRTEATLLFDPTDEASKTARTKVEKALKAFAEAKRESLLLRYPADQDRLRFAERPVAVTRIEVASRSQKGAYSFAPLLGMLIVVMALTGAFYPAVDLAAGEKERGTLETLLVAPVTRSEIVLGKFLAIWVIAVVTALLNLFVMGLTFSKLAGMLGTGQIAFEVPFSAMAAVIVILFPTAALFSAVALALSSFATSYKEGQHYMSPLFLVAMPLAMMGLLPNVEIGYVFALIPIANVVLLVKAMLLGGETAGPAIVAAAATALYAVLALWAAVKIFQRESVLFRTGSGKSFDAVALRASKQGLPTEASAVLLFFVVLALMFFLAGGAPETRNAAIRAFLVGQLLVILMPTLLFARVSRVNFKRTFAWRGFAAFKAPVILAAAAAGVCVVVGLYARILPESEAPEGFEKLMEMLQAFPPWLFFVLVAVIPPICEEFLCRGYLMAAFRPRMGDRLAILVTAALFAALHLSLVRFPATFLAGVLLGVVRVRTGSLFACILFHVVWNGLTVATTFSPEVARLLDSMTGWPIAAAIFVAVAAVSILVWSRPPVEIDNP